MGYGEGGVVGEGVGCSEGVDYSLQGVGVSYPLCPFRLCDGAGELVEIAGELVLGCNLQIFLSNPEKSSETRMVAHPRLTTRLRTWWTWNLLMMCLKTSSLGNARYFKFAGLRRTVPSSSWMSGSRGQILCEGRY